MLAELQFILVRLGTDKQMKEVKSDKVCQGWYFVWTVVVCHRKYW